MNTVSSEILPCGHFSGGLWLITTQGFEYGNAPLVFFVCLFIAVFKGLWVEHRFSDATVQCGLCCEPVGRRLPAPLSA